MGVAEFDFPEREREREREDSLDPYLNMAVVGGGGDRRFLTDVEG